MEVLAFLLLFLAHQFSMVVGEVVVERAAVLVVLAVAAMEQHQHQLLELPTQAVAEAVLVATAHHGMRQLAAQAS
jgi:hypothetical protein